MNKIWQIETDGKPLETVHKFLTELWTKAKLDAMMLPLKQEESNQWDKEVITSPISLSRSNPFTPIMVENIAQFIPQFIADHPDKKLAVLLRPCEMRALSHIQEKLRHYQEKIIFISADCLGTFPEDEFSWRANRKGSQDKLTDESIRFSRQGGIAPYRYRAACQLCENPIANQADLNINIVGIPVREKIMVSIPNGIFKKFEINDFSRDSAAKDMIKQHKSTSAKLIYRNQETKKRLSQVLVENTNLDINSLVEQINECGECTNCMDVCPICNTYNFSRNEDGTISRDTIAGWIISCAGCGMCEQACSQHKPLAVIFSIINDQLMEINTLSKH